jgi:hypothetical protein
MLPLWVRLRHFLSKSVPFQQGNFFTSDASGRPGSGVDAASVDAARHVKNGNLYQ